MITHQFSPSLLLNETIKLETERMKILKKLNGMAYPESEYYRRLLKQIDDKAIQYRLVIEAFEKEGK